MHDLKKTVVSFADGAGNYIKAMARLELSLKQVGFDGVFKGINDYGHIGSPLHRGPGSVPYAFKALSIKKAIEDGADLLLWCDSVVYATRSIAPLFREISQRGVLLFDNVGFSVGDYTSDACLANFGLSREDAFNVPMIMACVMGFDLRSEIARAFLDRYIAAALDGVSYVGDWFNGDLQVSSDMRCKGHRHDQSVASILAHQLGIPLLNGQSTYFAYDEHKGRVPVNFDSVCLWSGGI